MKKLLFLLLLLPLGLFASCSDENDFPSVDLSVNVKNAVDYDGQLYIVAGQPLQVDSIGVKGLGDKAAAITGVNYALDHLYMGYTIVTPFAGTIDAAYLPVGQHLLTISFDILQVDKTIAYSRLSTLVNVVASEADLPAGTTPGDVAINVTVNPQK